MAMEYQQQRMQSRAAGSTWIHVPESICNFVTRP